MSARRKRPRPTESGAGFAHVPLDRRRFLVLVGGAAALHTLAPAYAWARKAASTLPALQPWTLPDALPAAPIEAARALIGAAILAPSHMNSQPWRFEVDTSELRLMLDAQRTLPLDDPDQRFAHMSLGAALENMLIAARAWGHHPSVRYLPWGTTPRAGASLAAASVAWQAMDRPRDRLLFSALTERRSNARSFDGRAITIPNRSQLLAQVGEEVRVHWLEDRSDVEAVADLAHDAVKEVMADRAAQAERRGWLRGSDDESRKRGDGTTPERLGLGGPAAWISGRSMSPKSRFYGFGASSLAKNTRDLVESAGALALLTLTSRHDAGWIVGGQAYERFALRCTTLGIAQQPLSAPIASTRTRAILARRFQAEGEEPLLLIRLGHAKPPSPTPRRGVALVSTYRMS